jgi:hypothetical protein
MKQALTATIAQKNGDSWGYESPDEEDIEVCIRSIDLWGILFIDYYNVACQGFFLFFSLFKRDLGAEFELDRRSFNDYF